MNGQESNQTEMGIDQTERKIMIHLTADEVVGLIMEWAESFSLPEWMEKMMENIQYKYLMNKPLTEEEKIRFITAFVYGMPNGEYMKDVVLRFLRNYRVSEE